MAVKTTFLTNIKAVGNNTGIEVPPENIAELGASKKPAVKVNVAGYSYSSTVAVMSGKFMIALSKAHREAAGRKAGDEVEVTLQLDPEPRTVEIPSDLAASLVQAGVQDAFDALAFSKRKEAARQVEEAKTQETRNKRIAKIVAQMSDS